MQAKVSETLRVCVLTGAWLMVIDLHDRRYGAEPAGNPVLEDLDTSPIQKLLGVVFLFYLIQGTGCRFFQIICSRILHLDGNADILVGLEVCRADGFSPFRSNPYRSGCCRLYRD